MSDPTPSRKQFPALQQFLRGYLHEDWKQEYESVQEAAHDFWEDADADERNRVRDQWLAFTKAIENKPLEVVRRRLRELGSAWQPSQASDLDQITRALQPHPSD